MNVVKQSKNAHSILAGYLIFQKNKCYNLFAYASQLWLTLLLSHSVSIFKNLNLKEYLKFINELFTLYVTEIYIIY